MAFALNLNLSVSFEEKLFKGDSLMSWIDNAAKKAKDDDDDRSRREQAFDEQRHGLWISLVDVVRRDVETINRDKELLARRLRNEPLKFEELNTSSFKVSKKIIPSLYATVTDHNRSLTVERQTRKTQNGQS